jgi:hypothetical protein
VVERKRRRETEDMRHPNYQKPKSRDERWSASMQPSVTIF